MKKYDLVIFDLDGTLLDTSEGIMSSIKYAIQKMGLSVPNQEILQNFIGPPIQQSFSQIYNLEGEDLRKISDYFRNQYKEVDLLKAVPYVGIYKCLELLINEGTKCAVATYKREDYALKLLKAYGFDKYMDVMHGSDFDGLLTKADIIEMCINEACIYDKNKVLMVGDTMGDSKGAAEVGVNFLGVSYGFGNLKKLNLFDEQIIGIVNSPTEIYLKCRC